MKLSTVESIIMIKVGQSFWKVYEGLQLEYSTPGKGFRGKQFLLECDDDVLKMHEEHQG